MKQRILLTLIAILAFSVISAEAQVGNLKNKIQNKVKSEQKKPDKDKPNEARTSSETTLTPNGTTKTQSQAGFDPKYPPGVLFSSLLSDMVLHPNGNLAIEIIATFLPPAKSEKLLEPYNEVDGGKIEGVIKRADGSVHYRKLFRGAQRNGPFWRIYPAGAGFVEMTPGDYVLELLVENKLFYRFPFSVVREGDGGDPFAKGAGDKLILKGAWDNYAYLHLAEGKLASNLYFKIWLRSPVKRTAKVNVEIVRGGKVVASGGNDRQTIDLPIRWERREIGFQKPGGSSMTGTDIFGTDGDYKITVKIDDKLYGEYQFTIKDQKFVYLPEQRRGETDFTTMIEGGNDAWFVKRK